LCPEAERAAAYQAAGGHLSALYTQAECIPAKALLVENLDYYAADAAASATRVADADGRYLADPVLGQQQAEAAAHADLLRCIFGAPFRQPTFDPAWRTETAVALALQQYENRNFTLIPILGDALADAGCPDGDVLEHCRGTGPHVRGCHVVDLVLGRS
jgi:hypothetical protein